MPVETVIKSVGTSTSRATPIQKSEKRAADMNETSTTPITKEAKRATGVKEKRNWMNRKVARIGCLLEKLLRLL